jgi:hypothetical protein
MDGINMIKDVYKYCINLVIKLDKDVVSPRFTIPNRRFKSNAPQQLEVNLRGW